MIAYTLYRKDGRVRREAEALVAQNVSVICLTPCEKREVRTYRMDGVLVRELPVRKYRGKSKLHYLISYVVFAFVAFLTCSYLYLKYDLAVVHVHNMPNFLILAAILPRCFGGKVVLDIHDSVPETWLSKFSNSDLMFRLLCYEESLCCSLAHKIICVNHIQRDVLLKRGVAPKKLLLLMNVPDPRIFNLQARSNKTSNQNGMKLAYHGTMSKRLGVDLIIAAVAKLRDEIPGIQLYLWGSGDDLLERCSAKFL